MSIGALTPFRTEGVRPTNPLSAVRWGTAGAHQPLATEGKDAVRAPRKRRSCVKRRGSEVAAGPGGLDNPLDPQAVRRLAQATAVALGPFGHLAVGVVHRVGEPLLDLVLGPAEVLEVLGPLEVRDDHATGVGEHVGDDEDATLGGGPLGAGGGRAVRAL